MTPDEIEEIVEDFKRCLPSHLSHEQREMLITECRDTCSSFKSPGAEHVVGAPLVEVHHITIETDDDSTGDGEPLKVYGFIKVTNAKGGTFYLYNQPEDDPDIMDFGDELVLKDEGPIFSPFPATVMDICLRDKSKSLELACGTLTLDYSEKKISLEEKEQSRLHGKDGFVCVSYTTFEAAVVAHVNLKLCTENENDLSDDISIVGEISASYKSNYSFVEHDSTSLLSMEPDHPLKAKVGTSFPLYKSIMAVPVYSSLVIEVSFTNLVDGRTINPALQLGFNHQKIKISDDYFVEVWIQWRPGNPSMELELRRPCYGGIEDKGIDDDDDSSLARCIYRRPVTWEYFRPQRSMQVFSIVIIPDEKLNQDGDVNLHGEIVVDSVLGEFYLFKRDASCPESFPHGEGTILMLEGPHKHCFEANNLSARVELKDVRGSVFCKGWIAWDTVVLSKLFDYSWYDRRLCSIIRGKNGLVKMHYSIFENAVRATVMVLFSFDHPICDFDTNVSGSIVASYGIYDYTPYDKKYYQNVLFSKSRECSLNLSHGRKIPLQLLKSVISVPKDSSLIVEVDLLTVSRNSPDGLALKGVVEFEFGTESCWRLKNEHFFVDVLVDWG